MTGGTKRHKTIEAAIQKLKKTLIKERREKEERFRKEQEAQITAGIDIDPKDSSPTADSNQGEIDRHNGLIKKLIDNLREEIATINLAIQKIDENSGYGICEVCKKPIPIKRLLARPSAKMCVPCKTKDEKRNKQKENPHLQSLTL